MNYSIIELTFDDRFNTEEKCSIFMTHYHEITSHESLVRGGVLALLTKTVLKALEESS